MTATLLAFNGYTENQTEIIRTWLKATLEQLVAAYVASGVSENAAQRMIVQIQRSGLNEANYHPTELDRVAHALARAAKSFGGEYEPGEATFLCADAQTILATQIPVIGRPAIQLIRSFAKLQAAVVLGEH